MVSIELADEIGSWKLNLLKPKTQNDTNWNKNLIKICVSLDKFWKNADWLWKSMTHVTEEMKQFLVGKYVNLNFKYLNNGFDCCHLYVGRSKQILQ